MLACRTLLRTLRLPQQARASLPTLSTVIAAASPLSPRSSSAWPTSSSSLRTMSTTPDRSSDSSAPLLSRCEPCSSSMPALSSGEVDELLQGLQGWYLSPQPQTLRTAAQPNPDALKKSYKFKDWSTVQTFANSLGQEAEDEGHHPAIMIEWGRVSVWWWSHSIKGLHKNDFVMASRTDELASKAEGYRPFTPKAK